MCSRQHYTAIAANDQRLATFRESEGLGTRLATARRVTKRNVAKPKRGLRKQSRSAAPELLVIRWTPHYYPNLNIVQEK